MISAVAFCPMAPVLVPEISQGAAAELDDLRAACRTAIRRIAVPGRQLVVLGPADESRAFTTESHGTLAGFGVALDTALGAGILPGATRAGAELPLSLTIGAWLLQDALGAGCGALGFSVSRADGGPVSDWEDRTPGDLAVLVMGDGSARRSVKAPGYLDERAEAFDARIAEALAGGEGASLRGLYDDHDQLQTGTAVWELLSRSLAGSAWAAELLYDAAPYGVGYFVAAWTLDAHGCGQERDGD